MADTHNPILSTQVVHRWRLFEELPQPTPGSAVVLLQAGQPLLTLGPGERLAVSEMRWGKEKTLYEIDLTDHSFVCRCTLPGARQTFVAAGHVTYCVAEPATIVTRSVTDARAVLEPWLVEALGRVSQGYGTQDTAAAERTMREAIQRMQDHVGLTIKHFSIALDVEDGMRVQEDVFQQLESRVKGEYQEELQRLAKQTVADNHTAAIEKWRMGTRQRNENMPQASALDPVIRRVYEEPQLRPGETLVRLHADTKESVAKKPWFSKANLRYYIVSGTEWGDRIIESKTEPILLSDFSGNREIAVIVAFQVSCPPGNETRVAQAVCHAETPQEALHGAIARYVREFVTQADIGDFIDKYYDGKKQELCRSVELAIRQHLGFAFSARVSLRYEEELKVVKLSSLPIVVALKDSDEEHHLTLSADVAVHPQHQINAILQYPNLDRVGELVKRTVQAFFAEHVTVHTCYYNIAAPTLQLPLRKALQSVLEHEGRTLERLSLEVDSPDRKADLFVPMVVEIPHRPYGSTEDITIKNDLQLVLQDYGKYKQANCPELHLWVKNVLEKVITKELFGKTYLDILLDFQDQEKAIKSIMKDDAEQIGFDLHQLVKKTDMKENSLQELKLYTFNCPDLPTGQANISVSLQVVVTLKIPDLKSIADLLNQNRDVLEAMHRSIQGVLEQGLHQVDPETIYMKFSLPTNSSSTTLQEDLVEQVRQHLQGQYHADVPTVTIKPLDNAITQHINKMMNQLSEFRVEVLPFQGEDSLIFQGNFRVTSVDHNGWGLFRTCDFNLSDIRAYCEKAVTAELKPVSQQLLDYTTPAHRAKLEEIVDKIASEKVAQQYGVIIHIDNFDKEDTPSRRALAESAEAERRKKIDIRNHDADALVSRHLKQLEAHNIQMESDISKMERLLEEQEKIITSTNIVDKDDMETYKRRLEELDQKSPLPQWSESGRKADEDPQESVRALEAFLEGRKRPAPQDPKQLAQQPDVTAANHPPQGRATDTPEAE